MTDLFTAHRGVDTQTEEKILARLYGEPLEEWPDGLYIPPEALRSSPTSTCATWIW